MAKQIDLAGYPIDQPPMSIPGEIAYRETDFPGSAKYGGIADLRGPIGQRKGNHVPEGDRVPPSAPFKNARKY